MGKCLRRARLRYREVPVFNQILEMFIVVVAILLIFQLISNHIYERNLADTYLTQAEGNLRYQAEAVFEQMHRTAAIPAAVAATTAYSYIRSLDTEEIPARYYSIIDPLRKSLNNQLFLQGIRILP